MQDLQRLRDWLIGAVALLPGEAAQGLERAIGRGQLLEEPVLHCRALDTLFEVQRTGAHNGVAMGFQWRLDPAAARPAFGTPEHRSSQSQEFN